MCNSLNKQKLFIVVIFKFETCNYNWKAKLLKVSWWFWMACCFCISIITPADNSESYYITSNILGYGTISIWTIMAERLRWLTNRLQRKVWRFESSRCHECTFFFPYKYRLSNLFFLCSFFLFVCLTETLLFHARKCL